MTNPQLLRNLLEVIRSLPHADRRWLLVQLGQHSGQLRSNELPQMALIGQAFDDLAQEPDLYSCNDGDTTVGRAAGSRRPGVRVDQAFSISTPSEVEKRASKVSTGSACRRLARARIS